METQEKRRPFVLSRCAAAPFLYYGKIMHTVVRPAFNITDVYFHHTTGPVTSSFLAVSESRVATGHRPGAAPYARLRPRCP